MATFAESAREIEKIIDEKGLAVVFDVRFPKLVDLENFTQGSQEDRYEYKFSSRYIGGVHCVVGSMVMMCSTTSHIFMILL